MKRSIRSGAVFIAILLGSSLASGQDLPNYDAYLDAPATLARVARSPAASSLGVALSFDTRSGVPAFLWASQRPQGQGLAASRGVEDAARLHLGRYAHLYDAPRRAADAAEVALVHDTGSGGIVVTLRQRIDGIEVYRGEVKVLMKRNLDLVAISGSLRRSGEAEEASRHSFLIGPSQAVAKALEDLHGIPFDAPDLRASTKEMVGYQVFDLAPPPGSPAAKLRFLQPARVKPVFFPMSDRLVPAYFLELFVDSADDPTSAAYAYVLAADDGRLLLRRNLTESDSFNYRVWAHPTDHRPLDGPQADFTPHPASVPDGT